MSGAVKKKKKGTGSHCKHVLCIENISWQDIRARSQILECDCPGCPSLPDSAYWLCLQSGCFFRGCDGGPEGRPTQYRGWQGESPDDHSKLHSKTHGHPVAMNAHTRRIWCYACDSEVLTNNVPKYSIPEKLPSSWEVSVAKDCVTPYVPSDWSTDDLCNDLPSGAVGLQNLGNTCYMNSALQALSCCVPLSGFMLKCPGYVTSAQNNYLAVSFLHLVQRMWSDSRRDYITPRAMVQAIQRAKLIFRIHQQQDSQEFLRCFMDSLHEQLKVPLPSDQSENSSDDDDDGDGDDAEEEEDDEGDALMRDSAGKRRTPSGLSSDATKEGQKSGPAAARSAHSNGGLGSPSQMSGLTNTPKLSLPSKPKKPSSRPHPPPVQYQSIVSDTFDGLINSSVQCLTCNRLSSTKEAFQDLSLPIPSGDSLRDLQGGAGPMGAPAQPPPYTLTTKTPCDGEAPNVVWRMLSWIGSWFWGPNVSLSNCLAAFFSKDELKGDNMYSCEKCKKLRNGLKSIQVLRLPEILCIHLKRFRHEYSFSSKISSYVEFPLTGLDMSKHVHKDCASSVMKYDLVAVICHHGSVGDDSYNESINDPSSSFIGLLLKTLDRLSFRLLTF